VNTRPDQQPNCKTGLDLFANALREFLDLKPIPRPRIGLPPKGIQDRTDLHRFYVEPARLASRTGRTPIRGSGT
jgi:hypothetical protein